MAYIYTVVRNGVIDESLPFGGVASDDCLQAVRTIAARGPPPVSLHITIDCMRRLYRTLDLLVAHRVDVRVSALVVGFVRVMCHTYNTRLYAPPPATITWPLSITRRALSDCMVYPRLKHLNTERPQPEFDEHVDEVVGILCMSKFAMVLELDFYFTEDVLARMKRLAFRLHLSAGLEWWHRVCALDARPTDDDGAESRQQQQPQTLVAPVSALETCTTAAQEMKDEQEQVVQQEPEPEQTEERVEASVVVAPPTRRAGARRVAPVKRFTLCDRCHQYHGDGTDNRDKKALLCKSTPRNRKRQKLSIK